jgi:hypothetical protein
MSFGPQRDPLVAGVASESQALLDQSGADAEATGARETNRIRSFATPGSSPATKMHPAFPVDLGDPGRFPSWVVISGVVGDDPGHQHPVIVGGVVSGTWSLTDDQVVAAWFAEAGPPAREALAEEVARLATILGRPLQSTVQMA